jgi:hypothetical protein
VLAVAGDRGPLRAATGWTGDLQTGDFSQWVGVQDTAHMGAASVGSHTTATIVRPAGMPAGLVYAADLRVWPDSCCQAHVPPKDRVELNAGANATAVPGQTDTLSWWSYFPSGGNGKCLPPWEIVQQWATGAPYNTPSIGVTSANGAPALVLNIDSGTASQPGNAYHRTFPLTFDRWHHFVETVSWSRTANGRVTLTVDGQQVVSLAHQTMPADVGAGSFKQGVYESQQGQCGGEQLLAGTVRT